MLPLPRTKRIPALGRLSSRAQASVNAGNVAPAEVRTGPGGRHESSDRHGSADPNGTIARTDSGSASGERAPGEGIPVSSYGGMRWTSAGVPIARLWGELDVANASDVFAAIRKAVGPAEVIVDFSEVTFIDCIGLAELVTLARAATVRVVAPHGTQPRRVLEVTGLVGALSSFDTVEAALRAD
jgi:anti-sigma B factor antagonist